MLEKDRKHIYQCFPEGKFKVLTLSYDDGKVEDYRLVQIFNEYGLKGTFHVNSGIEDANRIPSKEYPLVYAGHEVACHTYTHPTIARLPLEQVAHEILEDRKNLERIMCYPVQGMSYPNGSYSKEIKELLKLLGIKYSRIVGNSDSFALPNDLYEWKSTCHHNHNLIEHGREFIQLHKSQYLYMMYVWGHSYEFTNNNNWELIENFAKLIGGREDIWYATNIEYVNYMEVLKRLQFSAEGTFVYNPSVSSGWLTYSGQVIEVKGGETVYFV